MIQQRACMQLACRNHQSVCPIGFEMSISAIESTILLDLIGQQFVKIHYLLHEEASDDVETCPLSIGVERRESGVEHKQIIRSKSEEIFSFWSGISVGESLELRIVVK